MHLICIRKLFFVLESFIITDETTFIIALLIKLRKLKVIVDNYGWRSLKMLSVTKGKFDK